MKANNLLASYDIFDTTLIRKCGDAQNIFYILSKKLFPQNTALATDFYVWRSNAESCMSSQKEHTIEEIYNSLPNSINYHYSKKEIIKFEKEIETENLVVNNQVKNDIQNKRNAGFQICFISDMYLDSSFLKSILIHKGCANADDYVFVSCEHGVNKRDGGLLYDVVKKHYKGITKWFHFGDNIHSDVKNAKHKGIKAHHINTSYSKAEKIILEKYKDYPFQIELSILIGLQRAIRINEGGCANVSNACDLVAPIYIPYVNSVINKAEQLHIETLYFLSRDAYILFELAKVLAKKKLPNLRYLYISRKSILPACKQYLSEDNIQLTDDQRGWDSSTEDRSIILQYLRQEKVLSNSSTIGMVDVGWRGTTRYMLNKLKIEENDGGRIVFFYYGYQSNVIDSKKGNYIPYIKFPINYIHIKYWIELIENYFSAAPHTSTIGYIRKDNMVEPLLESNNNEEMSHVANINIEVCKRIAEYISDSSFIIFDEAFCVWGTSFLKLFDKHPNLYKLETFKDVFYYNKKFIMEVSFFRLLRYFITGSTGLPCIDELSIIYSWGIKVRRRYTLHTIIPLSKFFLSKFQK